MLRCPKDAVMTVPPGLAAIRAVARRSLMCGGRRRSPWGDGPCGSVACDAWRRSPVRRWSEKVTVRRSTATVPSWSWAGSNTRPDTQLVGLTSARRRVPAITIVGAGGAGHAAAAASSWPAGP